MEKKKVIIYGNCHTMIVEKYLEKCDQFKMKYEICHISPIQEIHDAQYFQNQIFKECDVFIHQSIREKNRYGKEFSSSSVIKLLKPECKIIAIPNVYHLPTCLFPQYTEETELRYKEQTYFFRDRIIDDYLTQGRRLDDIVKLYQKYEFNKEEIRKEYDIFIQKVKKREEEWDVKVAQFIEDNIDKAVLFYDPNHPTNFLIRHYVEGILDILLCGEPYSLDELEGYNRLDSYQMPIHQSVMDVFKIDKQVIDNELRYGGVKVISKPMYLEDYIRQYFSMIWATNDFDEKLIKKSKYIFIKYKFYNIIFRVTRKIKLIK